MNITEFLKKWDNGNGFDWSGGCGGCGWNSSDNGEIWPAEVEDVGSYDKLAAEFKLLTEDEQKVVAPYFSGKVGYELLRRLDPVHYNSWFRGKFDNGASDGSSEDDFYSHDEIVSGGGYMFFKKELSSLNELARRVVLERLEEDAAKNLTGDPVELFWATYDNGGGYSSNRGNGKIDQSEIDRVNGWKVFADDIKGLADQEAIRAFDSLTNPPPTDVLARWQQNYQHYFDEKNLKQLPSVRTGGSKYALAHDGLDTIKEVTGKDVGVIGCDVYQTNSALPPFNGILATDPNEQFYLNLMEFIKGRGCSNADPLLDINSFAKFVEKNRGVYPTATVARLVRALQENAPHYAQNSYLARLAGIPFGSVNRTGEASIVEVKDIESNSWLIEKLKDLRLKYEKKIVGHELTEKQKKRPVHAYFFEIPELKAEYNFVVCDNMGMPSASDCMWFSYSQIFDEYAVQNRSRGDTVYEAEFNEALFAQQFLTGAEIEVVPTKGLAGIDLGYGGIIFPTPWFLRPLFSRDFKEDLVNWHEVR